MSTKDKKKRKPSFSYSIHPDIGNRGPSPPYPGSAVDCTIDSRTGEVGSVWILHQLQLVFSRIGMHQLVFSRIGSDGLDRALYL